MKENESPIKKMTWKSKATDERKWKKMKENGPENVFGKWKKIGENEGLNIKRKWKKMNRKSRVKKIAGFLVDLGFRVQGCSFSYSSTSCRLGFSSC